jgi:choline dehydrogenase
MVLYRFSPYHRWAKLGVNEVGISTVQDLNSGSILGCQYATSTISQPHEIRESSESSFLAAAAGRPNLKVFSKTLAKKILFSGVTATGVKIQSNGTISTLEAKKEIIVSAGAFQSPQILMVSGIGPESTLRQHNIPCIANRLGVGQGMHDHVFFGPSYRVNVQTFTRLANVRWNVFSYLFLTRNRTHRTSRANLLESTNKVSDH